MRIPPETIRSLVGLHASRVERTDSVSRTGNVAGVYRATAKDGVNLSDEATLLNTLKQGVKAMPDVDPQRVQTARQELAAGTFKIEPREVAKGLIMELGGLL